MFTIAIKKITGLSSNLRTKYNHSKFEALVISMILSLSPQLGMALAENPFPCCSLEQEVIAHPIDEKLTETVLIEDDASPRELGKLLLAFRKAGILVTNRINRKRKYNWIKDIHFHFQHSEGLNFKVKITGFQKLAFQFVYDAQKEFKYFTFRINDEEVYNLVELDIKGFKNYVCYDTGLVVMGETNEDIIRFY